MPEAGLGPSVLSVDLAAEIQVLRLIPVGLVDLFPQ
jgi:hypothetical protein